VLADLVPDLNRLPGIPSFRRWIRARAMLDAVLSRLSGKRGITPSTPMGAGRDAGFDAERLR